MGVTRASALLIAALLSGVAVVAAQAVPPPAAARAGEYLVRAQLADGSWGTSAPAEEVADGVSGLVAAGVVGAPLTKALNYIAAHGPADADRPSHTARVVLALVAAGRNPRDFGRVDYVGRLRTYYNPNNGNYDAIAEPNALAMLALVAAKEPVPEKAVTALQSRQCGDGGFPRSGCLFGSGIEPTALVLSALAAAKVGPSDPVMEKGLGYLHAAQNTDAGFGRPTAALATALAVNAIVTMGEDPKAVAWRKSPTTDPLTALAALQESNGGLRADTSTPMPDPLTTAQALPGFAGRALPLRPESTSPTTTSTTAPGSATEPTSTSTTRRPVSRGAVTTVTRAAPTSSTTTDDGTGVAAPAGRTGGTDNGRPFMTLLPFVATLFGAGAVGVVLRRRSRI